MLTTRYAELIRSNFTELAWRSEEIATMISLLMPARHRGLASTLAYDAKTRASSLLSGFETLVEHAESPESLSGLLEQMVREHVRAGVGQSEYLAFRDDVLGALGTWSGPLWSGGLEQAWLELFNVVIWMLIERSEGVAIRLAA